MLSQTAVPTDDVTVIIPLQTALAAGHLVMLPSDAILAESCLNSIYSYHHILINTSDSMCNKYW